MGYKLITGPATEPISTTEAKLHLKIETTDTTEDALLAILIKAAREICEEYTRRTLISQTWELQFDSFSESEYMLEKTPVSSITSVKYYDQSGMEQTVANTVYELNQATEPNKLILKSGQIWPSVRGHTNDCKIRFVAGYTAVPGALKAAMLLIIGHLYENREDVIVGRISNDMPKGSEYLMNPYRLFTW